MSSRQQWPPRRTKNGDISIVFQSREKEVVRRGQIRRIGWVIKTVEAHVGQLLLGYKCPVSRGIVVQEQDSLGELPAVFFLQNILQLHQQRWVKLRVDSSAFFEDNQWGGCRLDPKKSRRELFQRIFTLGIFWGGLSRYAVTPLIVALSPCHSDKTRFHLWSAIATGNHLDRAGRKNSRSCSDDWHRWVFEPRSGISGPTSRRASAFPNLKEWWTQPAHVRCPVAQLFI